MSKVSRVNQARRMGEKCLRPRTVFCMVSFVEKICVLVRREIRKSGPTAFKLFF